MWVRGRSCFNLHGAPDLDTPYAVLGYGTNLKSVGMLVEPILLGAGTVGAFCRKGIRGQNGQMTK